MTTHTTSYSFSALLTLFPTDNGGRKKPIYSHYRPSFSFSTQNLFSGEVSFDEGDDSPMFPGSTKIAKVKLLPSAHIRQNLKSGDSFTILDGTKLIGTGVIQVLFEA